MLWKNSKNIGKHPYGLGDLSKSKESSITFNLASKIGVVSLRLSSSNNWGREFRRVKWQPVNWGFKFTWNYFLKLSLILTS